MALTKSEINALAKKRGVVPRIHRERIDAMVKAIRKQMDEDFERMGAGPDTYAGYVAGFERAQQLIAIATHGSKDLQTHRTTAGLFGIAWAINRKKMKT